MKIVVVLLGIAAVLKGTDIKDDSRRFIHKESKDLPTYLTQEDFESAKNLKESDQQEFIHKNVLRKIFYQGDIAMVKPEQIQAFTSNVYRSEGGVTQHSALSNPILYWPNGEVPYVISSRYTPLARKIIASAVAEFHEKTCIKFVPRTTETDYISIQPIDGCFSFLGRQGRAQPLSLESGCFRTGTIIHELLHVIGFIHEQSRPDRDDYVSIIFQNIIPGLQNQFDKLPPNLVDFLGTTYDYGSVMHYGKNYFSVNGKDTIQTRQPGVLIGQRDGFSQTDLVRVKRLYKCEDSTSDSSSSSTVATTESSAVSIESSASTKTTEQPDALSKNGSDESCLPKIGKRTIGLGHNCYFLTRAGRSSRSYILLGCRNGKIFREEGSLSSIQGLFRSHRIFSRSCRSMMGKGFGKCCGHDITTKRKRGSNGHPHFWMSPRD